MRIQMLLLCSVFAIGCGKHHGPDPAAKKTLEPGSTGADSDRKDNATGSASPVPAPAAGDGSAIINGVPAPNGNGTVGP